MVIHRTTQICQWICFPIDSFASVGITRVSAGGDSVRPGVPPVGPRLGAGQRQTGRPARFRVSGCPWWRGRGKGSHDASRAVPLQQRNAALAFDLVLDRQRLPLKIDVFPPDTGYLFTTRANRQCSLQIGADKFPIWRTATNHAGNCSRCRQSSFAVFFGSSSRAMRVMQAPAGTWLRYSGRSLHQFRKRRSGAKSKRV